MTVSSHLSLFFSSKIRLSVEHKQFEVSVLKLEKIHSKDMTNTQVPYKLSRVYCFGVFFLVRPVLKIFIFAVT